jgi:phosphatidylinositol glycan class N
MHSRWSVSCAICNPQPNGPGDADRSTGPSSHCFNSYDAEDISSQTLLVGLAMAVTSTSIQSLQAKQGLPLLSQIAGWVILRARYHSCISRIRADVVMRPVLALIPPFFPTTGASADAKLVMYFLTFGPCFIILSINAEGLFYVAYCATLWLWIRVEAAVRTPALKPSTSGWNPGGLRVDDIRIALFFLFFVQAGFFGTGK